MAITAATNEVISAIRKGLLSPEMAVHLLTLTGMDPQDAQLTVQASAPTAPPPATVVPDADVSTVISPEDAGLFGAAGGAEETPGERAARLERERAQSVVTGGGAVDFPGGLPSILPGEGGVSPDPDGFSPGELIAPGSSITTPSTLSPTNAPQDTFGGDKTREAAIFDQELDPDRAGQVYARYLAEASPNLYRTTPFAQGAIQRQFQPRRTEFDMASAFRDDLTFLDFLGEDRPSVEEMTNQLIKGLDIRRMDPMSFRGGVEDPSAPAGLTEAQLEQLIIAQEIFSKPSNELAFLTNMMRQGVAPSNRRYLTSGLNRIFNLQQATQPELPFLEFARERGYF